MNSRIKDEEKILSPEFLEEMKRIRKERGISIEEVAEKTNIKVAYIKAIENGDMDRLPGGIYTRAFIRSISEFLGIDTRPFERKVESDEMIKEKQVKVELGRPQNASMPSKLTIIGCIIVIFFLYWIFYGPKISKKEQVKNAIENYQQKETEIAKKKIETAKTPEEKDIINTELQAKISNKDSLIKKIDQVSPVQKETEELVSKELVITLLATNNVKVTVKDYYGKILINKDMVANEATMLNGSDQYFVTTDNISNLEIYLDGVLIKDTKKIEKSGDAYIFKAEKLVNIAEGQAIVKPTPNLNKISDKEINAKIPEIEKKQNPINPVTDKTSADKTKNKTQGSGR